MATSEQIASLIAYRGGMAGRDEAFAGESYDQGEALVKRYVGAYRELVPNSVYDGAVLEVATKVWLRRSAPSGQDSYLDPENGYTPIPRDPMVTAYPILDRFLPAGFA